MPKTHSLTLRCPKCGGKTRITSTRPRGQGTATVLKRRHACLISICAFKFVTYDGKMLLEGQPSFQKVRRGRLVPCPVCPSPSSTLTSVRPPRKTTGTVHRCHVCDLCKYAFCTVDYQPPAVAVRKRKKRRKPKKPARRKRYRRLIKESPSSESEQKSS